jgi:hypothetical protein
VILGHVGWLLTSVTTLILLLAERRRARVRWINERLRL